MGGKSQEYVVGYQYFMGLHTVACMAPVDGFSGLWFDDRLAWEGPIGTAQIEVNAPELFGGRGREGGVAGFIDYLSGRPDQGLNDYLAQVMDSGTYTLAAATGANPALVPNFRGYASLVFRAFYFGNNPYFKNMRQRWHNIFATYQADTGFPRPGDWYPQYAPTCIENGAGRRAVFIAMDNSGSFASYDSTASSAIGKDENLRAGLKALVSSLGSSDGDIALHIHPFNESNIGVTNFERIPFTSADVADAHAFIDNVPSPGGQTDFGLAAEGSPQFFEAAESGLLGTEVREPYEAALQAPDGSRVEDIGVAPAIQKTVIFTSDGFATQGSGAPDANAIFNTIPGVSVHAFAFDTPGDLASIDTTPGDGVPIIYRDEYDAFTQFVLSPFITYADLNGVHILRDVLIAPSSGGSGIASEIDDATFAAEAARYFSEGMGFSFHWQNTSERDAFKKLVEFHCGCVTFKSRVTGTWKIKSFRPGYDVNSLFTYDRTNCEVEEWSRPMLFDLPNYITVVGRKRENGETMSLSDGNYSSLSLVGRMVPKKIDLEGVYCPELLAKMLDRFINSETQPLGSGAIRVAYVPSTLEIGDEFIINIPGAENVVVNVTEFEEQDGVDTSVLIRFSENVHQYDPVVTTSSVTADPITTGQPTTVAQPSPNVYLQEASYYDLAIARGQSAVDETLANNPDFGVWQGTADRFDSYHQSADVVRDDGTIWVDATVVPLMPTWTLLNELPRVTVVSGQRVIETQFQVAVNGREIELAVGQMVEINGERMRVDEINIAGSTATFTVGRGVLDTVPVDHPAGSVVTAWPGFVGSDGVEYSAGETVDLRFLPSVPTNTLDVNDATTETVAFNSRAIRPYPVRMLQVDGDYAPPDQKSGDVLLSWVGSNKLTQMSLALLDHDDGGLEPEAGIQYYVVQRWVDSVSGVETRGPEVKTAVPMGSPVPTDVLVDVNAAAIDVYRTADSVYQEIGLESRLQVGGTTYINWQTPFVPVFVSAALTAPYNLMGAPE